ncbi:hypothetical protein LC653_36180 [Nostoc sp. CHAB 5784]|uniref:hypothetical protein n=1 Tax=Nostoc mirabile TaxID=2907820 RepID=UPI001E4632F6|nr:hypothetical protein [Nostoc mirabile]MCC5669151.1 hypothetical protein [Nostoc mirabile CHAB5784]
MILDEATSALDYATERQMCLNLAQVFKGRTVFFITHRLGTIQNADVILMMSQGRIAEQGTHAELMALPSFLTSSAIAVSAFRRAKSAIALLRILTQNMFRALIGYFLTQCEKLEPRFYKALRIVVTNPGLYSFFGEGIAVKKPMP